MVHLDLTQIDGKSAVPAEMYVRRGHTMLLAAGIASFTIVAVAALMMAWLF